MNKSLNHRITVANSQGELVAKLAQIYKEKQKEADQAKENLKRAKTRLQSLQDDLLGDLLNRCFEEVEWSKRNT